MLSTWSLTAVPLIIQQGPQGHTGHPGEPGEPGQTVSLSFKIFTIIQIITLYILWNLINALVFFQRDNLVLVAPQDLLAKLERTYVYICVSTQAHFRSYFYIILISFLPSWDCIELLKESFSLVQCQMLKAILLTHRVTMVDLASPETEVLPAPR